MRCAPPLFPPPKKTTRTKNPIHFPSSPDPRQKMGLVFVRVAELEGSLLLGWFLLLQAMLRKIQRVLVDMKHHSLIFFMASQLFLFLWDLLLSPYILLNKSTFQKHREHYETNRPHHTTTTNYTFPPVVLTISRSEAEVNLLVPLAGCGIVGHLKHQCFFW